MGGCQNYGPLLGPLNIRCRIILRTQKGTVVLTTTHITQSYTKPKDLREKRCPSLLQIADLGPVFTSPCANFPTSHDKTDMIL